MSNKDRGPGWYEWLTDGTSLTRIAYVHEDGSMWLPEGTDGEFLSAAARDRAWLMVDARKVILDDEPLRELLSYCKTEEAEGIGTGFGAACGLIAERLAAILDGEQ